MKQGAMGEVETGTVVRVLGEPFRIRGASRADLVELASYVDRKLEDVRTRNEALPLRNLLILTCLNIAEELLRERREREAWMKGVVERTRRMRESLEQEGLFHGPAPGGIVEGSG